MNDPDTSTTSPSTSVESEVAVTGDARPPMDASPDDQPPAADSARAEESPAEAAPAAAPAAEPNLPAPVPHAGARYAALRLLMLAAVGGILYLIGMRGWLLAFAAVLVSGIVSLFLFMKQRNDAAVNLEHQVDSWKHRHDHEDAGLAQE